MSIKAYQAPIKSTSDRIKDSVIGYVIALVLYCILASLAKAIIEPFKFIFMSDRQRFALKVARTKEKIGRRVFKRDEYENDTNNMLNQYLERIKIHPEAYRNDPDNAFYKEWFRNLKNGSLIDSDLKWSPEIYDGDSINNSFLNYLSNQVEIHRSQKHSTQLRFLKTIRNFYPEFTPKFSVLISEIKGFQEKIKSNELTSELVEVVVGSGIPGDLAKELVKAYLTTNELKEAITVVKSCTAKGYSIETARFFLEHRNEVKNMDSDMSDTVNRVMSFSGNCDVALALIRGDFDYDDLNRLLTYTTEQKLESKEELAQVFNSSFYRTMKNKSLKELAA